MLRAKITSIVVGLALTSMAATAVRSQSISRDNDDDQNYVDRSKIDRYLDVEIWANHSDGDYYVGDNVVLRFRANGDAFVAIYSIDSRGRVNLLFPVAPSDDNFVRGGQTYRLPGAHDDFDLVLSGPEGVENIQIIASREKFPIPDWYQTSGLLADWDDRLDYMDYLNNHYFVRYPGQRFAYDRTALYVNEWEEEYFRPVYDPDYPTWTMAGNVYFDYPYGSSLYINGIYWGATPLYIPRLYVGWHTFSLYDSYGYCWESDVHVTRYHTVVLDHHNVVTSPNVRSKYKEVRFAGYRNPSKSGYTDYTQRVKTIKAVRKSSGGGGKAALVSGTSVTKSKVVFTSGTKKHIRGESKIVKTNRGLETAGSTVPNKRSMRSYRTGPSGKSASGFGSNKKAGKPNGYRSGGSKQGRASSGGYRTSGKGSRSAGSVGSRKTARTKSSGAKGKVSRGTKSGKSGGASKKTVKSSGGSRKTSTPAVKSGGGKRSGGGASVKSGRSSGKSGKSSGSKTSGKSSGGKRRK